MSDTAPDLSLDAERQRQVLRAVADAFPATVVVVDSSSRYRFVNKAFEEFVGMSEAEIIGRSPAEVMSPEEGARRRPFMQQAFAGETVEFVLDYPGPEGTTYRRMTCVPLRVEGIVDGFVGISEDITELHRKQQRLEHLAERDPLTGLLNRAGFERRVEHDIVDGSGEHLALLYVDLDRFKPVNDTYGHLVGDHVLQEFARRMVESVRGSDSVARLGGDEFAILLPGVRDTEAARVVADKVLAAAAKPFAVDHVDVRIGASVGVAVTPRADANWRELLGRADVLLYRAKAAGAGQSCVEARGAGESCVEARGAGESGDVVPT